MRLSGSGNFGDASPQAYTAKGGTNRVRREPAVVASSNANYRGASGQSKSNSRSRAKEFSEKLAEQRRQGRSPVSSKASTINTNKQASGIAPRQVGPAG